MDSNKRIIYVDGIFDLFHKGHVLHFKQVKYLDDKENILIVGIINDNDAKNYKRQPIYDQENRAILVKSCKYVDKIIENAPLVIDKDFIEKNNIDMICHSFASIKDTELQKDLFKVPIDLGIFRPLQYNSGISTTDIINKIKNI
jgi:choline-phosphate cytidylyltransferase